jgi:hypothetical protein
MPDSVLTPAPVRTTQGCISRISSVSRSTLTGLHPRVGELHGRRDV